MRTLLIHCARAALLAAKRCQTRTPERLTQLQRWALQTAERIGYDKGGGGHGEQTGEDLLGSVVP